LRTARSREHLSMVRSASKRRSRNSIYMSVVVIDGNMPTDYDSCWYLDCKCWRECSVNGKPDNCPLRPLPEKHGRLGDLDEIMNKLIKDKREEFTKHYVWLMLSHYGAETIVEPEGK